MHLGFGIIMGLFLSLSIFNERSLFKRRLWIILSLLVPVVYHGVYNYDQTFATFPLLTLILVIGIIYYHRREQQRKITESIDKRNLEKNEIFFSYFTTILLVAIIIISSTLIRTAG